MHGKLKFLHMANFFSTNLVSEVSDKYQVWQSIGGEKPTYILNHPPFSMALSIDISLYWEQMHVLNRVFETVYVCEEGKVNI